MKAIVSPSEIVTFNFVLCNFNTTKTTLMTLIAHSTSFKVPFVVGDILLSSSTKQPFTPPTIFADITEHLNEADRTIFPCDISQKVYVISPNLVIALSGNVYEMKQFLIELKHHCKRYDNNMKAEYIHQFLSSQNLSESLSESSFFMMLIEPTNSTKLNVSQFDYGNWNTTETALFNDVVANGSGAGSFGYWTNEDVQFVSSHEKGDIEFAIQSNACLIARLLALERSSLATIKKNWGAGFELVLYKGNEFIKYEQIAYLIFESEFDEQGTIRDPVLTKVMYYKYINELLLIESLDIIAATATESVDSINIKAGKVRLGLYPVPPIDFNPIVDTLPSYDDQLSFYTERVVVSFIILKNKERLFIPAFFNEGPEIKVHFQSGKSFELTMLPEALNRIRQAAKAAYPNI